MEPKKRLRSITPERAQAILLEHGKSVTLQEAAMVLELLYQFADEEVTEYFNRK